MTDIQFAWEALANTLRLYTEATLRFGSLASVDAEEAVDNVDRAFEAVLERFHTLYDVTNGLAAFCFFDHGDTSLLLTLRNAVHHRDHKLFRSWKAMILEAGGVSAKAGAAYLFSTYREPDPVSGYYLMLEDFYARLEHPKVKKPLVLREQWNAELSFSRISAEGARHGY